MTPDFFFVCSNLQPSWEVDLILLFSRLAEHNIGYVDWEPVTPLMFSKILHNFGLPVCYRYVSRDCTINSFAVVIV